MRSFFARTVIAISLLLAFCGSAAADILLSELCDPRYNYQSDRYIEIFNSGTGTVSLTGWSVIAVGNTNDIFTWNLSGSIEPGQALVCGDATTIADFPVNFAQESWSNNNGTWNGKVGDGAKLVNNSGTLIDYAVVPGTTFENSAIERNEGITSPSTSWNGAQWTATAINDATESTPGSHHAPPVPEGPTIQDIVTDPEMPQAGQDVLVTAVVLDSDHNVTNVEVHWGLSSGSLGHVLEMPLYSGNFYRTVAPIAGQGSGETVFYQVSATNDAEIITTSDILSYQLPWTVSIADIQGTGTVSPHLGHTVITSGIVTADFGSYWVIQDGSGPRSGLWIEGTDAPLAGSSVSVMGSISEMNGNTTLTDGGVLNATSGTLPTALVLSTAAAGAEDYEGVLVQIVEAVCTTEDQAGGQWFISNDAADLRVDDTGYSYDPNEGSVYTVIGPMSGNLSFEGIVPRSTADITLIEDPEAPSLVLVESTGPTSLSIVFSEDVDETSAEDTGNYSVSGTTINTATRLASQPNVVEISVQFMEPGQHTLTVDGVEDLFGNAVSNLSRGFLVYGGNIPAGYYDGLTDLVGEDLRLALHNIIDGHNSVSYSYLWTAFYSTDARPDGTVWDMYSDVPGGVSPYIYEFGIDQTGGGATEGTGYNREHSWPQSWYGGSSPMYTDLFVLYPTDVRVNGMRSNYAYGEVSNPTWTSMNGCKVGSNTYPGYSGTVFEPIDEYKGDFARAYLYMSVRYYTEDSSWSGGSPMADRSQLLPWAEAMLLEWSAEDPVSQKEIDRNDEVYDIQHNRNPFIDRPDLVARVFTPELTDTPDNEIIAAMALFQNTPNPFNPSTVISYELDQSGLVQVEVYDLKGRLVKVLNGEYQEAGRHEIRWNGDNTDGRSVAAGVYLYRLTQGHEHQTRRMMLIK